MTAASIVSGSIIERAKTIGFLIIAIYVGAVAWVLPRGMGLGRQRLDDAVPRLPRPVLLCGSSSASRALQPSAF